MTPPAMHIIAEAEKLAFADRNRYIADPDYIVVPSGLTDDGYLAERRRLIDPAKAMAKPEPGLPPGLAKKAFGKDATHEVPGTTHVSIIDDEGNAVSMTASIESAFGSHLWAAGFLLNNELTDFSFVPVDANGNAIANAVAGGKRPRSSMAPTIVLDRQGNPEIVTGSPGGSQIILYVVKALVAMLDWEPRCSESRRVAELRQRRRPVRNRIFSRDLVARLQYDVLWPCRDASRDDVGHKHHRAARRPSRRRGRPAPRGCRCWRLSLEAPWNLAEAAS